MAKASKNALMKATALAKTLANRQRKLFCFTVFKKEFTQNGLTKDVAKAVYQQQQMISSLT